MIANISFACSFALDNADPTSQSDATSGTPAAQQTTKAASDKEIQQQKVRDAVSAQAGPAGVPYNSAMAVFAGPGNAGKTSLLRVMQGQPLSEQRESTRAGDRHQLEVCVSQQLSLDLKPVQAHESRQKLAVLRSLLNDSGVTEKSQPITKLWHVVSPGNDHEEAVRISRERSATLRQALNPQASIRKSISQRVSASTASQRDSRAAIIVGHQPTASASSAASSAAPNTSSRAAFSLPAAASGLENLGIDTEAILSRVAELEKQGIRKGLQLSLLDLAGQPEFAPLITGFIRK